MNDELNHDSVDRRAVDASLRWSGWGSPVGLSVFIVACGLFLVCLQWAGLLP